MPPLALRRSSALASPRLALAFAAPALLLASGCDGCGDHRPYAPYTLSAAPSAAVASSSAPPASGSSSAAPEAEAFRRVDGAPPPGDGQSFPLGDATVRAPTGRAFATGLVLDADGDGAPDLLAWARSADGLRGELYLAPGSKPQALRVLAALPAAVGGEGCTASPALAQIGASTALFDFRLTCAASPHVPAFPHIPPSPQATRWLAVLALGPAAGAPEIRLELRLRAPSAEGSALDVAVAAQDLDADGLDDLLADFTLTSAGDDAGRRPASAKAPLRYYNRPAGLARDPSEPEASLLAQATRLARTAGSAKDPASIVASAVAVRELRAALCGDGGAPLVQTAAGTVPCAKPASVGLTYYAEGSADLRVGDAAGAIAAAELLKSQPDRPWERKDLDKLIVKAIPSEKASLGHRVEARPAPGPSLRFNEDDALLVTTLDGVVLVFGPDHVESDPREGVPSPTMTPSGVYSPDGKTSALVTPRGVLVSTPSAKRSRLLTLPEGATATTCAANDGGKTVACVINGEAVYLTEG